MKGRSLAWVAVLGGLGLGCSITVKSEESAPKDTTAAPTTETPAEGTPPDFNFDPPLGATGAEPTNPSSDPTPTTPEQDPTSGPPPPPPLPPVDKDPGPSLGRLVWGVDRSNNLVSFRVDAPDQVSIQTLTGLAPREELLGIDFRPANGQLYGLGSSSQVYAIDRATGVATAVGPSFKPLLLGQAYGFDFNPVADRIRVHTDVDQDLRINPDTGAVAMVDGMLRFAPGDVNENQSPNVIGTAYTNSVAPAPSSTILYGLDSTRNLLVKVDPPNDGVVTTIGSLGVDFTEIGGFDIVGPNGGVQTAYAAIRVGDATGLYTVDLDSGAASLVGPIAHPYALAGIAIEP